MAFGLGLATLCTGLIMHARDAVHLPPRGRARACAPAMITELTKKSWCANVDDASDLAVVFFYAKFFFPHLK